MHICLASKSCCFVSDVFQNLVSLNFFSKGTGWSDTIVEISLILRFIIWASCRHRGLCQCSLWTNKCTLHCGLRTARELALYRTEPVIEAEKPLSLPTYSQSFIKSTVALKPWAWKGKGGSSFFYYFFFSFSTSPEIQRMKAWHIRWLMFCLFPI